MSPDDLENEIMLALYEDTENAREFKTELIEIIQSSDEYDEESYPIYDADTSDIATWVMQLAPDLDHLKHMWRAHFENVSYHTISP